MIDAPGVLTISLDTELAWGCFDTVGVERHEPAYRNTREVVRQLCKLFDCYGVSATWTIVAHLLDDCADGREESRPGPDYSWVEDWYEALPCQTGVDRSLWYAPDLLETIQGCETPQEVGLHGDTHMILGAQGCSRDAAVAEIEAAVDTVRAEGIDPASFVYPRNRVGHRDVLLEYGITAYRGRDAYWYERSNMPEQLRKPFRFLDEALIRRPPVVTPVEREGVVEIPGSQVFRPNHGGWEWTPDKSQVRRAQRGLDRAVETGEIFHLWFHPFNLAREPDALLDALETILQRAATLRADGQLEILPFQDIVTEHKAGRWGST